MQGLVHAAGETAAKTVFPAQPVKQAERRLPGGRVNKKINKYKSKAPKDRLVVPAHDEADLLEHDE